VTSAKKRGGQRPGVGDATGPRSGIVGRDGELRRIQQLLDDARGGRTAVLVLQGEPGIGKTTLLREAARRADGMTVLTARGVEPEAEVPYSGLYDTLHPLLQLLRRLPVRQAQALQSAFALSEAGATDRFGVGAATLTMLATAAERQPVALLIDDAQVLDRASIDALVFAVRRLEWDAVAALFATSETVPTFDAAGWETIMLRGLDLASTAQLVPPDLAAAAHRATAGNPLALSDFRPTDDEAPIPVSRRIEAAFFARTADLPTEARAALLMAAAAGTAPLEVLTRALTASGTDPSRLEAAEAAGLVEIRDGRLDFSHPLVRAAIYQRADPATRRAAHRALAEAFSNDPKRRAAHLAAAAVLPDEQVAAELEEAGRAIRAHGLFDAALTPLRRAVELSPAEPERSRRALLAAETALVAGHIENAGRLLGQLALASAPPPLPADAAVLRARIAHVTGDTGVDTYAVLCEQAGRIADLDPERAAHMLALAAELASSATADGGRALEAARRAAALVSPSGDDPVVTKALGDALLNAGKLSEGLEMLARAAEIYVRAPRYQEDPAALQRGAFCLERMDRFAEAYEVAARAVQSARRQGAVGLLPSLVGLAGEQCVRLGRWEGASAHFAEAAALAEQLGQLAEWGFIVACMAELLALRGQVDQARAAAARAAAHAHGSDWTANAVGLVERTVALGSGDVGGVLDAVDLLDGRHAVWVSADDLELLEIAIRGGQEERALRVIAELSAVPMLPLAASRLARCRGQLIEAYEEAFETALAGFTALGTPLEAARTELALGERRRRQGQRVAARAALRSALSTFDDLGAELWAQRASRELRASGERLRRGPVQAIVSLTPQEEQIARLVTEGRTNREIGSILFISPKTVEAHLSRVFRKLEVRSRLELAQRLARQSTDPGGGTPSGQQPDPH
jgi:DNA-binding CsgD family transcriptional regulator